MTISFVIPNFNGVHLLKNNLPKIINQAIKAGIHCREIIIVDDLSTDGSVEWLKGYLSQYKGKLDCRLIEHGRNEGFASTVNDGVASSTSEIVVLLNTDVTPDTDLYPKLLKRFSDPNLFGVGFLDNSLEKGAIIERGRGIGWWSRGLYLHKRGETDSTDTSWISGGSSAIRRSYFMKLHGFNELYNPFYWEDIDLSYRAIKAGYTLLFDRNISVIHDHAKGAIKSHYTDSEITKISYRNQFLFVFCNASFMQMVEHILFIPLLLFRAVKDGNTMLISGYGNAICRILFHLISNTFSSKVKSRIQ